MLYETVDWPHLASKQENQQYKSILNVVNKHKNVKEIKETEERTNLLKLFENLVFTY